MTYINKNYWNNFYKSQTNLNNNSTFSEYVMEHLLYSSSEVFLVDLGCGTGKDSFFFAQKGIEVLGVDGSDEVIKINNDKKYLLKLEQVVTFKCVDLSDHDTVKDLMNEINMYSQKVNKKVIIYNRFFLHAIPEEVEDIILQNIADHLLTPFWILGEFRTREDEVLDKVYGNHYRRYVDTDELIKKVLEKGLELKSFYKGQGLSVYKNEDPYLARIIVGKEY